MNFAKKISNRRQDLSVTDFPDILPFEEIDRDFSRRSLDIPQSRIGSFNQNSRSGAGRALSLSPEIGLDGPVGPGGPRPALHDLSKPYQFTHVDAPETFRAGHSRGNYYHNVKDIAEHEGAHHLQEVSDSIILDLGIFVFSS